MKLLISVVVLLSILVVVLGATRVYQVVGRVCPSCGTPGGEPDESGDTNPVPAPGDVTLFAFLAPAPVNPCWCAKCGNKWRIVRG